MAEKLTIGGNIHICNDKLDYQLDRLSKWYNTNPQNLEIMLLGLITEKKEEEKEKGYENLNKEEDFGFWVATKVMKLNCNAIEALRCFHESLAEYAVKMWEKEHGSIIINNTDFPHNYSSNMIKLKNSGARRNRRC